MLRCDAQSHSLGVLGGVVAQCLPQDDPPGASIVGQGAWRGLRMLGSMRFAGTFGETQKHQHLLMLDRG